VTCSSETSGDVQRTTRHYITEDNTLHNNRFEGLKSLTILIKLQYLMETASLNKTLYVWYTQKNNGTHNSGPNANADFVKIGFNGEMDFIFVRYSTTNNVVPSNNRFGFCGNVVKVSRM
jgi:hypothetical protein